MRWPKQSGCLRPTMSELDLLSDFIILQRVQRVQERHISRLGHGRRGFGERRLNEVMSGDAGAKEPRRLQRCAAAAGAQGQMRQERELCVEMGLSGLMRLVGGHGHGGGG